MQIPQSQKTLIRILSDARFHSGNELAQHLGISRTSVWKQIRGISNRGLEVSAVSGRGYRLNQPLELLDRGKIVSGLTSTVSKMASEIHVHDEIESTNGFLIAGLSDKFPKGSVCLAENQTAGRGRNGREWISPFGSNIYLSVLWRFQCGPADIAGLSLAIGVAVMRVLDQFVISGLGLKWPNDIWWRGRKLGGILIDVLGDSYGPCSAIIGLGLNRYVPVAAGRSISQEWVDLRQIMGPDQPGRNPLIAWLLNAILPVTANYEYGGLTPFLADWKRWDCISGNEVTLHLGDRQIQGRVKGISDKGLIRIRCEDGEVRSFASGEVSIRPRQG